MFMRFEVELGVGEVSHSRCGVSGVALNAPKPDENLSGMQGNKDEAMKSNHINPHKSRTPAEPDFTSDLESFHNRILGI